MLAHELNSPMTAIKGFGDALREQSGTMPEEQRRRFLDILATEIGRLARLVNDLLDVSRMEAGALRYELEPLSLQGVVNDLLASHPSLAAAHVLESRVPRDVPLVLGDKDRIRQVLLNLLTNATRYAPEETTITITAETLRGDDAGYVKVGVADEGIGIAPEHRESVFSKFVMLPKPSSVKQGTGLGLFITKSIVEGHGGRIWVESEPGRGSTFYFSLRVA
jgi:two-component system phosphate regulon sensor histidine kinase PhoR